MDVSHDVHEPGPARSYAGTALEIRSLPGRPGIRAAGEINVITRSFWEHALEELADAHTDISFVELSDLMSIDVGGAAALAVTAQRLHTGRIVVDRPPPELERILDMFWPGLSMIEVAGR
ncbi:STAS domain-containing protein [Streptomyces sp. MB09-02B]|uniref:STAS domain-containing protein n=1 Tax=Streptomyces sp. MB09-02B TaxID=3028667 RepID=UPI0029B63523|nr:STAS domain-containing protein [Streptomyces sp. MB09-02B]MDX3642870.1 STAS domain-containing protein [Streptomyces sp. MB09-02B]